MACARGYNYKKAHASYAHAWYGSVEFYSRYDVRFGPSREWHHECRRSLVPNNHEPIHKNLRSDGTPFLDTVSRTAISIKV